MNTTTTLPRITTREKILLFLRHGHKDVGEIAKHLGISNANVNSHIGQLRRAGKVQIVKRGIPGRLGVPSKWGLVQ